ncbi:S-adenosyl-methyltransferase MraW [Swaminathania salitolerans LMG 21291]|uniref:Ribosomal RNA small subunit methyltransferase H n=1 Tax=Swaminathania salitolerans TaxID=182838 RepID=A0A511BPI8_9PROT|nr:16S rRNA (cytosine(1402)-N(4))-methyltransferase RsmH [Swaminathania salitolerans]GBQ10943.1 S-adenosyl-methyltransferase MraW [Swaminathania salitolerans LMG 21291]GEL02241.1 ribosomal RNA small subunit methyltransferase H [Swaminathania salitolerans]
MTVSTIDALTAHDPGHVPVMLAEVISALAPKAGGRYVDGTFGGGGYSRAVLREAACTVWGIDRDPTAIHRAEALAAALRDDDAGRTGTAARHLVPVSGTFGAMSDLLASEAPFDGIVLDIGVSSYQLDEAERGFSFRQDGPLDMRMSSAGRSAADLVNESDESALADIIYHYGEDRLSRRIAAAIVRARAEEPIRTTARLADIVRGVVRPDKSGIHPATRTFQALRIAVNDELGELQAALDDAPALLDRNGVFVVVTFHSLEDRLVKRAFAKAAGRVSRPSRHEPMAERDIRPDYHLPHARPVLASEDEIARNPRARSAKLRSLVRSTEVATHSASPGSDPVAPAFSGADRAPHFRSLNSVSGPRS